MERKRTTQLNISVTLLHQLATMLSGLVLPRLIIEAFGSQVNGLMQSVTQILSYTMLMEMGIGGVVLASFYKPLADGDEQEISGIFNATKSFFCKISLVFIGFALVLSLTAKFIIRSNLGFSYIGAMVIILAINTFFSYYFGLPHQLLLKADRKLYVVQSVQIVSTLLNLLASIIAIKLGAGVHLVKLLSAFVFILNPVVYRLYVKKHYDIIPNAKKQKLNQKKDALLHHLAYFIHRNTDAVVLSMFTSLEMVSVYSVYNAVIVIIENLLNAISSGVAGTIGNMLAKNEKKTVIDSFDLYVAVNTFLTSMMFTVAGVLMIPFVHLYTNGISDVEYIRPVFAWLMLGAGALYCIRIPFISIASAAGHYKQTKNGAIGEVLLNVGLSLILVKPLELIGVAIGTLSAMAFRTGYIVWYLKGDIICRPIGKFVKSFVVNMSVSCTIICLWNKYAPVGAGSFAKFILSGMGVALVALIVLGIVNIIININTFKSTKKKVQ